MVGGRESLERQEENENRSEMMTKCPHTRRTSIGDRSNQLGTNCDTATSANSSTTPPQDASLRPSREKERQTPTRSNTGDDLLLAARDIQREHRPPERAKSADLAFLGMGLKNRNEEDSKYLQVREARRLERQQRPTRGATTAPHTFKVYGPINKVTRAP
jgi:hypothetical protein